MDFNIKVNSFGTSWLYPRDCMSKFVGYFIVTYWPLSCEGFYKIRVEKKIILTFESLNVAHWGKIQFLTAISFAIAVLEVIKVQWDLLSFVVSPQGGAVTENWLHYWAEYAEHACLSWERKTSWDTILLIFHNAMFCVEYSWILALKTIELFWIKVVL